MKTLWLCLIANVVGLLFVSWVFHFVTDSSFREMQLPLLVGLSGSVLLLTLGAYVRERGTTNEPSDPHSRRIAAYGLLAAIPIIAGITTVFYLIATSRYLYVWPAVILGVAFWFAVRALRKKRIG
jgi:hypothetical protein